MLYRRQEVEDTQTTETPQTEEVAQEAVTVPETPIPSEEDTFKKRYSDLRRYVDVQLRPGYQKQIDELKEQVQSISAKQITLPKSEEEVANWAKEYPDVAAIVETIAAKKAQAYTSSVEEKFKQVEERQRQVERSKAELELRKYHPDLDDIKIDPRFAEWVKDQPKMIFDAICVNATDALSAARALDLYKADLAKRAPSKPANKPRDAATAVRLASATEPPKEGNKYVFRESEVAKMKPREFEARYDEIMKARTEGKFLYDLSAAR